MDFLHFCPTDGWFGDAMPLYAEGVFHIYYTKLNKDKPMSWGHIKTTDFVDYTVCPDPFPAGIYLTPYNTGCVYYKDKKYYAFFAGQEADGQFAMYRSESDDGETFSYPGVLCFRRPETVYRQDDTWRDPAIIFDGKKYHCVFCAKIAEPSAPNCTPGVVGHAVSDDLISWECLPPLHLGNVARSIECPDLIKEGDRYYLGYYWHETRYRYSDSIDGEWLKGDVISPDHFDFMAAKQAKVGDRRISVGWLPRKNCDCAERIWGGNMLIPRELRFENNTPKTRFISELDKWFATRDTRLDTVNAIVSTGDWAVTDNGFVCRSGAGGGTLFYREMSDSSRIRFAFTLDKLGCLTVTLGAHSGDNADECLDMGYDLMFDASERMLRLREHYQWDQRGDIAVIPCEIIPGVPTTVDIVIDSGILEAVVNQSYSLVNRLVKPTRGGLALTVEDADAVITDWTVNIQA